MYRRDKIVISAEWHFIERCPHWPKENFIETDSLDPNRGNRPNRCNHICRICIGLTIATRNRPADKTAGTGRTSH
jgi:hypothetical protein